MAATDCGEGMETTDAPELLHPGETAPESQPGSPSGGGDQGIVAAAGMKEGLGRNAKNGNSGLILSRYESDMNIELPTCCTC